MSSNSKTRSTGRSLGAFLRDLRIRAGEGIKTAGPRLEVDYTYLSKIENDLVNPSADFLTRVAGHYGVDVDTLFLLAGRLPPDIEQIITENPREVIDYLRSRFADDS